MNPITSRPALRGSSFAILALSTVAALQGVASAQAPAAQFDVASIRELVNGVRVLNTFTSSGSRAEYQGFGIQSLIAEAWKVRGDQVAISPAVHPGTIRPMMEAGRSARIYNIVATAPEGTTPTHDEFRLMLQSLLTTRFKLKTHTEKRDLAVYVLSTDGTPQVKPNSGEGTCRQNMTRTPEGQKVTATHCPIQVVTNVLFVDRPIYDETGLTGFYDFEITSALPFQTSDPQAITPFSAVKDLGLKLEAKRLPVDTIVIDHVEAPGEN